MIAERGDMKQTLVFSVLFAALLFGQVSVHLLMNDALITLLPGDGCGQILDRVLQNRSA